MSRCLLSKPVFDENMVFKTRIQLFLTSFLCSERKLKLQQLSQGLVASWAGTPPSHHQPCKMCPSVVQNDVSTFKSDSSQGYKVSEQNQVEETYAKKKVKFSCFHGCSQYPFTCSSTSASTALQTKSMTSQDVTLSRLRKHLSYVFIMSSHSTPDSSNTSAALLDHKERGQSLALRRGRLERVHCSGDSPCAAA